MAGILYLCATPIGNLEDMTPRAQRMLAEADIIAAEDTRHTLQLLNRFNIKGRLVRYDEHSKERQGAYLLDELLSGKNIALVSDAGFPGIADPGEQLARLAIDAGVQVVPVPGANAALCALIASGLPASPFFFGGFLPKIVFMRLIALLKHSASFVPSHLKSQKPCVLVVPITTVADCAPVIKRISDAIATQ